jgi:hypothetical protein
MFLPFRNIEKSKIAVTIKEKNIQIKRSALAGQFNY